MEYIITVLLSVILVIQIIILVFSGRKNSVENIRDVVNSAISNVGGILNESQRSIGKIQSDNLKNINSNISDRLMLLEKRFETLDTANNERMARIQDTVEKKLDRIEKSNAEKLDNMRTVVDEKLQKTLETKMNESFVLVNDRLKQVYEGLGEMRTLASGVGDLKKVLMNVKTRGILGEIQLGAILEEILAPEQYDSNTATVPGSRNVVEYAIKLPADDDATIYLPIDSKFPSDAYIKLHDAYEAAEPERIATARSEFVTRIKSFAKDIHTKYIEPPYTTDFAIMFLPSESVYAETVNCGLIEILQKEYKVNIAGPSTMAALLNSLQMGFRTLAIQKRSAQVWDVLGAVKTEFDKFGDVLEKTQTRLMQINTDLDKLVVTRTNAIKRKLRDVERLDEDSAQEIMDK